MPEPPHLDSPIGPARTVEVADRVFAFLQPDGSWWINNTGFVVGSDGVLAIDASSTERRTRSFLAAISSVTGEKVRILVNTHHHGDHTNGNCLFDDALIVAHTKCREQVLGQSVGGFEQIFGPVEWGNLEISAPVLTFEERVDLHVDDVRVELDFAGGPAHTTGDVVAWLPDAGVLFAGDLVFDGGTPFVLMGSVAGSITALHRIRNFGALTIVPGHGGICGPDRIDSVEAYLRYVQTLALDGVAAGLSPLEAAREADLGSYAELTDPERIVGNLHRAYSEIEGLPLGGPIDVLNAFADMIAFNGGRPLRCLA